MLTINPVGSALGATIEGLEFTDDTVVDADVIRAAWVEYGVVFFPALHPTPDQHMALAYALGTRESHGDFGDDTREYERVGRHREIIKIANRPANRADSGTPTRHFGRSQPHQGHGLHVLHSAARHAL